MLGFLVIAVHHLCWKTVSISFWQSDALRVCSFFFGVCVCVCVFFFAPLKCLPLKSLMQLMLKMCRCQPFEVHVANFARE